MTAVYRITKDFGAGGAGNTPFSNPNTAEVLRALAATLVAMNGFVTPISDVISQADAAAQTGSYVQANAQTIADLAAAIKAKINAMNGGTPITTADPTAQDVAYDQTKANSMSALLHEIATDLMAANPMAGLTILPAALFSAGYVQAEHTLAKVSANEIKAYINAALASLQVLPSA